MAVFIVEPEKLIKADEMQKEKLNMSKLVFTSVYESIVWCASHNLIRNTTKCLLCNINKTFLKRSGRTDGYMWKCKKCLETTSIREGSIFAKSHLSMLTIIRIVYGFTLDFPRKLIYREAEIGDNNGILIEWCNVFREICRRYFEQHPVQIGGFSESGEPLTVEIDTYNIMDTKYGKASEQWVLGGVERQSGKLFVTIIEAQNEESVLPIISRMILPGSIIVSADRREFLNISGLDRGVYDHRIIHDAHYIKDGSVHTRTISRVWIQIKNRLPMTGGAASKFLQLYLYEFMWKEHTKDRDQFAEFLLCIAEQYKFK